MTGNDTSWTDADWEAWRAENRRLFAEGWTLGANYLTDGTVEEYAEKTGVRIDRTPKYIRVSGPLNVYGTPGV